MLTRFQQAKLRHYFSLFDHDNIGLVDFYNVLNVPRVISEYTHLDEIDADPTYWDLYDHTNNFWRDMTEFVGKSPEEALNVDDWLAFWENLLPALYDRVMVQGIRKMDPIFRALCEKLDPEGTGRIEMNNWSYFTSAYGVLGSPVEMFCRLDADNDGCISYEELQDMYYTFLFSDDPEEIGNYLFGVVYGQPSA